ncbi:hypothetical protein CBS101457_004939 [Exobasidium rhododendri]|nr:hypothetical protein CBS101457_004939 [Exobasidium rhododendri]
MALCPMGELAKRGLAPPDMQEAYNQGRGLGTPGQKRQDNSPPLVEPISEILSPLGLGALTPRGEKMSEAHIRAVGDHVKARFNERDEDVNIDAPVLTPKAHKRFFQERGLIGGLLAPLTGVLSALDVPTPQASGLQAIPGNDAAHQYIAPGATDVRGNCPTLNTLANHGYLSRDGITSFAEAANAIQTAYSMSFDVAVFLSALGLLAGGDIVTGAYSIGGQDSRVPNTVGTAYGIDRHGLFEIDASISRGDRYFGDSHSFNISRWNKLVSDANTYGDGLFDITAVSHNAADAVDASRADNPEFTFGGNFAVVYATRALLSRPLANGTAPNTPDFKNIAPFYLNETFPENWYRLPTTYSLADLLGDIATLFLFKPQLPGTNYNGGFVPANFTIPEAPAAIGCLALRLAASAAPSDASDVVSAADALFDQIFVPLINAQSCDTSDYSDDPPTASNATGEDANAGSGSGITHFGEYDSQSTAPTGASAGQAV